MHACTHVHVACEECVYTCMYARIFMWHVRSLCICACMHACSCDMCSVHVYGLSALGYATGCGSIHEYACLCISFSDCLCEFVPIHAYLYTPQDAINMRARARVCVCVCVCKCVHFCVYVHLAPVKTYQCMRVHTYGYLVTKKCVT